MYDKYDKKNIWKQALLLLAEEVDFGTLTLVQNNAYLDSVEQWIALIGCKSFTYLETFQRKRLDKVLEGILTEVCNAPIQVRLVHGRPRIIEKCREEKVFSAGPGAFSAPNPFGEGFPVTYEVENWADKKLAMLHAEYGDIMSIVDKHPVFAQVQKPLDKGGWGVFKKALTNYCRDYGVMTILKAIREMANNPKIKRPRAYLRDELRRGRWGHKLPHGAPILGPQIEAV